MKRLIWTLAMLVILGVASASLKRNNIKEDVVVSKETTVSTINWEEEKSRPGIK